MQRNGILHGTMPVYRMSAVERYGIPIDDLKQLSGGAQAIGEFMARHAVEPVLVQESEAIDVTPPYLLPRHTHFMYYLSSQKRGEAVIELLPLELDIDDLHSPIPEFTYIGGQAPNYTYMLPQLKKAIVICGPSPAYDGVECLHEAFLELDL